MRVFLSYRREDASGHAGRLYDLLVARYGADDVFMDIDAIPLGSDFGGAIDRAVASCDVLIALIGRRWLTAADSDGRRRLEDRDDFVRREIESALQHDVVVVPTCVQGASVPRADELPASLTPLAGRQGFELGDSGWRDDVARLVRRLEAITSERDRARSPVATPAPARRPRRAIGWKPIAAGLGLLAAAGAGLAVALSGGGGDSGGEPPPRSRDAERRLLALIPEGTRPGCDRSSSPDPRADASLSCGLSSALTAEYLQFGDKAAGEQWYTQHRIEENVDPEDGKCTEARFRGEAEYAVDGSAAGRFFCFVNAERQPELYAIDERENVGIAVNVYRGRGDAAVRQLMELWDCCIPVRP